MPFSGKTEAVKIAKDRNIPIFRMGEVVWDEVKSRDLELNDENVGFIANEMRIKHGKDVWAKRTVEKIRHSNYNDLIIIDGIRNIEEIDFFRKNLGDDFILISVEVSDEIRYERAMSRGRSDDSCDIEKIKKRDHRELSWGIDAVMASADIVVSNELSIDVFRKKVRKILDKV